MNILKDSISYIIDESTNIASLVGCELKNNSIFIPRSIEYDSREFIITSISDCAFKNSMNIKSIQFPPDSELQIIGKEAFSSSTIESFTIPPHLTKICERAFYLCQELKSIEMMSDSKLQTIEKDAFSKSNIESLSIPSSISDLQEGWCNQTWKLQSIIVVPGNEFNIISFENKFILGKSSQKSDIFDVLLFARRDIKAAIVPPSVKRIASFAFSGSSIESITIPSSVSQFDVGWCGYTEKLSEVKITPSDETSIIYFEDKLILGKTDSNSDVYDVLLFARRDVKTVKIPSFIKRISSYAFGQSTIEKVSIPTETTHIEEGSFILCEKLLNVEIPSNSKLKFIGNNAFAYSSIECFTIPLHLTEIEECTFFYCVHLKHVEIRRESELRIIGKEAFSYSAIEKVSFSRHVTMICDSAFYTCQQLKKIDFPDDSELQIIEKEAFAFSLFESFSVPPRVTQIGKNAFFGCCELQFIEIPENAEFQMIEKSKFGSCLCSTVFIPQNKENILI